MKTEDRKQLLGEPYGVLLALCRDLSIPRYSADQISSWIYKKHANAFEEMTDISKAVRERLNEGFEIGATDPIQSSKSGDGTAKYLFSTKSGKQVEAVFIPERTRGTLCLSTQIGCRRACRFCATGQQGFSGNLDAGDIVNQYRSLPERDRVTNIVYMGMGEPLDNFENVLNSLRLFCSANGYGMSPSRITVSTVGILPELRQLVEETRCNVALSLHSPFVQQRRQLMPVEREHPLEAALAFLRDCRFSDSRRLSFEYILFDGINDSEQHATELVKKLQGLRCRVNLIPFNPFPGVSYEPSVDAAALRFQNTLLASGIKTSVRKSRGRDIAAACGLLTS
jgi:23S rRNA (adenine2503-C2)-methyltransferase